MRVHNGRQLYEEQLRLAHCAMRMREYGVRIDRGRLLRHRSGLTQELENQRRRFESLVPWTHVVRGQQLKTRTKVYIGPFRLGETGQHRDLKRLFFGRLGIKPTAYTEEGEPQLDDDVLLSISQRGGTAGNAALTVIKYRELATLKSRYVDGLPIFQNDRIHPQWKCFGTVTGRFASQDPNAQNWPGIMRDILVADPDNWFVSTDMSSLELILMGLIAGDEKIISWYNEGLSGYLETAKLVYKDPKMTKDDKRYKLFKSVILGLNYGSGAETVWRQMLPKSPSITLQDIKQIIRFWFNAHPALEAWRTKQVAACARQGYVEEPIAGRRRYFYGEPEPTVALNHPFQGGGAAIMNRAILEIEKNLPPGNHICLQVHDQIDTQGKDPDLIKQIHEDAMQQEITLSGFTIRLKTETKIGKDLRNLRDLNEVRRYYFFGVDGLFNDLVSPGTSGTSPTVCNPS